MDIWKNIQGQKFAKIFYRLKLNRFVLAMEDAILRPPNNSGQIFRLEIKQKNAYTKKRKVKTWSPDEDDQLVKLYDDYPKKWGIIASMMQDRNQNQCLHRYRRLSQLGAHRKIWSADQDQTILSLIKKVGKNWKLLAEIMGTKTGKQIRQRFINKLDPKIKNDEWTDEEDKLILKYYCEVGSRWSQISKKLPGRPENKIKNRFYSFIQKNYDIKYVCVDPNSIEAQKEKLPVQAFNQKKRLQKCPLSQVLSQPQKPEKSPEKDLEGQNVNPLQQIGINKKGDSKQDNLKRKRKNRFKFSYSRFGERKNQQSIYEDENDRSPSPKKGTKEVKKEQEQLPSIKQIEDQFKIAGPEPQQPISRLQLPNMSYCYGSMLMGLGEEKDEMFESNGQANQKFYIKSLIRVEDDYAAENRYRSIRDLVSNNQIENQVNDLLYLSHH